MVCFKVKILGDIKSTVGFAAMDATLLRAVEAWYVPQLQLMAASASAFHDSVDKQAEAFYQLAYLQYIRGDCVSAEATGRHSLDLLENIDSCGLSGEFFANQRRRIIQTQLLIINSLHMQGKFNEARLQHFLLLNALRVDSHDESILPCYNEQTGAPLNNEEYQDTKTFRLRQKYVDALAGRKTHNDAFASLNSLIGADILTNHARYPYCALGIPMELTSNEDLTCAWAAQQKISQEQSSTVSAAAAALLGEEALLNNISLCRHVSSLESKNKGLMRSFSLLMEMFASNTPCYQDIAGPVVTLMQAFWPQRKSRGTKRSLQILFSHASVEPLSLFIASMIAKSSSNDEKAQFNSDLEDQDESGNGGDDDDLSVAGEIGSERMDDLKDCFDENDEIVSIKDEQFQNVSLVHAASSGFTDVVRFLLDSNADINSFNG
jgi:hypothetical protein